MTKRNKTLAAILAGLLLVLAVLVALVVYAAARQDPEPANEPAPTTSTVEQDQLPVPGDTGSEPAQTGGNEVPVPGEETVPTIDHQPGDGLEQIPTAGNDVPLVEAPQTLPGFA